MRLFRASILSDSYLGNRACLSLAITWSSFNYIITVVFITSFCCRNSVNGRGLLEAEAAAKALLGLPEDEVLAAEKGDGLMSAKSGDVLMGWYKYTHPATTEEGEAVDVGSTSCQSSYSLTYGPPTSPVSPPRSPELARVLDMAESLRKHHDEDDDTTAPFEPMESDDAVEERTSRVEPIED